MGRGERRTQWIYGDDLSLGEEEAGIVKQAGADYFRVAISALEQQGPNVAAMTGHIKKVLGV